MLELEGQIALGDATVFPGLGVPVQGTAKLKVMNPTNPRGPSVGDVIVPPYP